MTNLTDIFHRLRRVGAAVDRINGNNTHSGNFSMRDPGNDDLFYITSSGSQCGALVPQDIVPVRFSGVSWGDARASTESTIHRRILSQPGAGSVVHAHYFASTVISFDTRQTGRFLLFQGTDDQGREAFLFHPVDLYGAFGVGPVRVGSYFQPVGSAEMEERIPKYLKEDRVTIVRGHGSFVRGSTPEEALYTSSLLESSARLAVHLARCGVDLPALEKAILRGGAAGYFPAQPTIYRDIDVSRCDVTDKTVIDDFRQRLSYNYNHELCAYGAGSMSQKVSSDEMIFCPWGAVPDEFPFPLCRLNLKPEPSDSMDLALHKLIYRNTHENTCMITTSPLAVAEGMAVLQEEYQTLAFDRDRHPVIKPIDAEAIYLNPRLGLVPLSSVGDLTPENPVLNMLRWHKGCCVVAGLGVISTGASTLEQAAHNAASAERIARFRAEVRMNQAMTGGAGVGEFEPKSSA